MNEFPTIIFTTSVTHRVMTNCLCPHSLDPGFFGWKSQWRACWRLDRRLETFWHAQNEQGTSQDRQLSDADCFPSQLTDEVGAITAVHKLIENERRRRPLYALLINIIKEQSVLSKERIVCPQLNFLTTKGRIALLFTIGRRYNVQV